MHKAITLYVQCFPSPLAFFVKSVENILMDTLTPEQRHYAMSQIRSANTKPEKEIRSALFSLGFRFRKNDRRYPGTPDIVLPHFHAVIFVHGCFWHGHKNCRLFKLPKTNTDYWKNKIEGNSIRDRIQIHKLLEEGWRVGIVWECLITGKKRKEKIFNIAEKISLWLEEQQEDCFVEF